ncbi:MAG: T9SS type A sorting domain-containing protein [Bacteroidota bacterium]
MSQLSNNDDLHSIFPVTEDVCWAVADKGILKTSNGGVVGVSDDKNLGWDQPMKYTLAQNHPYPFNPTTTIRFVLPISSRVSLKVYDLLGREVATIAEGPMEAGWHTMEWSGVNAASGVYLYRLQAGEYIETRKLVLLK